MVGKHTSAAYGGAGWSPRSSSLREEIGRLWGACGFETEWEPLKAVLLHRPGAELEAVTDPNAASMFELLDFDRALAQHNVLARAYSDAGVTVHYVDPPETPPPNSMFVADLFFMTPEGAIVGRPASSVRAGEERWVARRLAALGVPILGSVRGRGTFEGADATWVDPKTVLLATGLRTNVEGAAQVKHLLEGMGVEVILAGLAFGAMHLMGTFRILDRDLVAAWPGRVPYAVVQTLRARGLTILFCPDEDEAIHGMALNVVVLGPRRILMPAGNPVTQAFYENAGIDCQAVEVDELLKAAGGIGCLTGILQREMDSA